MDDQVTLSWSIKNLITVNLMIALLIGATVLAVQGYRTATGQNEQQRAA